MKQEIYPCDLRRQTALTPSLKETIARDGPMSIARYMTCCLQDPVHGYYRHKTNIGTAGDFITAPEISQIFGELIGLWCAVTWQQMGKPQIIQVIELGPGRATLMKDALRAARMVPDFIEALAVVLVDSNATLKKIQKNALQDFTPNITWTSNFKEATQRAIPTIVIANEFVDTFPVRQLKRSDNHWFERAVILDNDDDLQFGLLSERPTDPATFNNTNPELTRMLAQARNGDIFETRQNLDELTQPMAELSHAKAPLAALFIDYGHSAPGLKDTLQAVRAHTHEHALTSPGQADLTTQVDFSQLRHTFESSALNCEELLPQMTFLGRLGIMERASKLMAANPKQAGEIEAAVARLMAPGGMGGRFIVLGVRSPGVAPLAGF